MGIVYLISIIILLVIFILVRKTEKQINIFSFVCISIVLLFCYNTFICYILTFFSIPNTLLILTIINLLISFIFGIQIFSKKQIQNYIFKKIDLLYIFLILIIVLILSYINFEFPINVKYETSDPAVHYLASTMFAETDFLLAAEKNIDDVYGSLKTMKPMSYVNSGLLMKCLSDNLHPMECYNIFVCFGIFVLFMTGATMYSTIISFARKKEHKLWAFIISVVCMLGYPLNSFLFGFEYLSMGLLIICSILCLIDYYDKNVFSLKWFITILALICFGLFLSYYMFVPFVYPALWIYFCIKNYTKTKKIVTKELLLILVITLLIPFGLGFIYALAPNIYSIFVNNQTDLENVMGHSNYLLNSGFQNNGYIYINLYSNMLLLLPLPIYMFVKDIKNKNIKNNIFTFLVLFFNIAFIGILFIGNALEKVSIYYVTKNYFSLWIILLYCNYRALILLSEKGNYLPRLYLGIYILMMIGCTLFSNVKMIDDALENKDENILSVMEIFVANKTLLLEKEKLNQQEIDILIYARENLDYNKKIEVVSEGIQYYWSYQWLEYINEEEETEKFSGQEKMNYKSYFLKDKINKVDYMIYFKRSKRYGELKEKLFNNAEIIYENSSGGILKYIK